MSNNVIKEMLEHGPVFLDGATGSNLMKAGRPIGSCAETWILEHPDVLVQLQRAYVAAGSQILIAPTFTSNRHYLAEYGLENQVSSLNRRLVSLSREAAGTALVAGDMTTLGRPDFSYEQLLEIYMDQAVALRDAGVDLFIIETMLGSDETMAAMEACRMVSDLPVICSFSVMGDGMLYFGGNVFDAALQLEEFGATAVGVNCSAGPEQLISVVRNLCNTLRIPVLAKPNAGMPIIDDNGTALYSLTPDAFAVQMRMLLDTGAKLLGGCCGTEPAHIAAMVQLCR